jgi:hypothetical protein
VPKPNLMALHVSRLGLKRMASYCVDPLPCSSYARSLVRLYW